MSQNLPDKLDADRALISEVAMDIGKSAVEHLEVMYPAALEAVPKTARLSLRNHIHNEIMAAINTVDYDEIRARINMRKKDRRLRLALYRKIRANKGSA